MPREKTGYVEWRGGEWKTQLVDPATKKKIWVGLEDHLPKEQRLKEDQKALAKQLAVVISEQWETGAYVPGARQLTVNEFFVDWYAWRKSDPDTTNQAKWDEQAYRLWIGPQLGTLPMQGVSRDRMFAFSEWLTKKANEGSDFGRKRARNIFAVVAAMFRDAYMGANASLRILKENPCADVPWPKKAKSRPLRQLLYPHEVHALLACPEVPIVRARFYAMALYTTTRAGEARVFECRDFDVANEIVRIERAADPVNKGETKHTKSDKSRMTTLEKNLAPLVMAMIAERKTGRLFPDRPSDLAKSNRYLRMPVDHIPCPSNVCTNFRADLEAAFYWACIERRPELFDDSDPSKSAPIVFHDLRATGITWRHARGDNEALIRQECGHEDMTTNALYIRALRRLKAEELFAPLPPRLLGEGPLEAPKGPGKGPGNGGPGKTPRKPQWCIPTPVLPGKSVPKEGLEHIGNRGESPVNQGESSPEAVANPPAQTGPAPVATPVGSDPEADLAAACRMAAEAGRWEVVNELSRLLAEMRREAGPTLRVVNAKR